jgi:hypothetical protein
VAEQPILHRTVAVASMPDTDWAATQVAPGAALRIDVTTVKTLGVVCVAYNAAGAVVNPSGTMSIACVDTATTVPINGGTAETVITTTPLDLLVAAGAGLTYDVSGRRSVTIRVAAQALAGTVTQVKIYWCALA